MAYQTSTKPYLIRAIHQWCTDNNYTPYLVVAVHDHYTRVPVEYVKNNEIILNVSYDATKNLMLENDSISFYARFNGASREVLVPIGSVLSIFARETGEGMTFEYESYKPPTETAAEPERGGLSIVHNEDVEPLLSDIDPDHPPSTKRPRLKVIK